jgi:predicted secreted protein
MRFFTIFLVLFVLISCNKGTDVPLQQKAPEGQGMEGQYQKELDEIKKSLKGDVKIKLKKEGKGGYSWEITGKDAQEVLKTNDALRKRLSDQ